MKYKCNYISGGGTQYDGGIWEKKETAKTIGFVLVNKPFFEPNHKDIPVRKFHKDGKPAWSDFDDEIIPYTAYMKNGHVIRDWRDGTYTAYTQ